MCGRYANRATDVGQWSELLDDWPDDAVFGYNVAPTQMVPAITGEKGYAMRWGMVSPWSKEPGSKYATFNARVETASEKPAFCNACIFKGVRTKNYRTNPGDLGSGCFNLLKQ